MDWTEDIKVALIAGGCVALTYLGIAWYLRRLEAQGEAIALELERSPNGRLKAVEEDVPSSAE